MQHQYRGAGSKVLFANNQSDSNRSKMGQLILGGARSILDDFESVLFLLSSIFARMILALDIDKLYYGIYPARFHGNSFCVCKKHEQYHL